MPHIFELPQFPKIALAKMSAEIVPVIRLTALTKTNTGIPPAIVINNTLTEVDYDISGRLQKEGRVTVTMTKPVLPVNENNLVVTSKISLPFLNPDQFFAATQSGALLDPLSIELATLRIEAAIAGSPDTIDIWRGKITDMPSESKNVTVLAARDTMYDIAKKTVLFENFGQINKLTQDTFVNSEGQLLNSFITIKTAEGEVKYYDGYAYFREDAELLPAITNDKATQLELTNITIKNRAALGKYTIEFRDQDTFSVTHPDGNIFDGTLTTIFESDFILIDPIPFDRTATR